jgi:hypothetical protein
MQIQRTKIYLILKNRIRIILSLILLISINISCQNKSSETDENKVIDTTNSYYPELEKTATIFTIPSPMQIASTLKVIDLPYNFEIIESSQNAKDINSSKYYQSLNLGLNIIDLGYTVLYEKNNKSINYLTKIEKITHELGIQDQTTLNKINKLKDNLYNKDSASHCILSAQNSITNYYQNSDEKEVGIWIISSLYIEGLYILTQNYSSLNETGRLTALQTKHLNILLLHQKLFLPNLCELYNILEIDKKPSIYNHLESLKSDFEKLNLSFKYDENQQKLKDVKLDNKQITLLNQKIALIRKGILNCNLK